MAYECMDCGEFEKINKDKTLNVNAFIAQEVGRRADVEREREKRSSTIPSPSPLAEHRRLLTPATSTSDFGKGPLLDGRNTESTGNEMETEEGRRGEEQEQLVAYDQQLQPKPPPPPLPPPPRAQEKELKEKVWQKKG